MTTKVTICNHGPMPVRVIPVDRNGQQDDGPAKRVLQPGEFVTELFVYRDRQYKIEEL